MVMVEAPEKSAVPVTLIVSPLDVDVSSKRRFPPLTVRLDMAMEPMSPELGVMPGAMVGILVPFAAPSVTAPTVALYPLSVPAPVAEALMLTLPVLEKTTDNTPPFILVPPL